MNISSNQQFNKETWHYTHGEKFLQSQATLAKEEVSLLQDLPAEIGQLVSGFPQKAIFYNGCFVSHLSTVPVSSAIASKSLNLENENPIDSQNLNLSQWGCELTLDATANADLAMVFLYGNRLEGETRAFRTATRSQLRVVGSGKVSILELHIAVNEIEFYANNAIFLQLEEGAACERLRYLWIGGKAFLYDRAESFLAPTARLHNVNVVTGGHWSRLNEATHLQGEAAVAEMRHVALLGDQQASDLYSKLVHKIGQTNTDQQHKSLLTGRSKSSFTGTISICQDAQKSAAAQLSRNLILDDRSEVNTRPQLEVLADDVKANHGATVGQLQEDEIFYLQSRGVSREEAKQLVARGFVFSALEVLSSENLLNSAKSCLAASMSQFQREVQLG